MEQVSKDLKIKKEKEAKQLWVSISPEAKLCKTCKFRLLDTKFTKGYQKANCTIFQAPEDKPMDVLWRDADCDFYVKDKEVRSDG